jgi:hypothetical protein
MSDQLSMLSNFFFFVVKDQGPYSKHLDPISLSVCHWQAFPAQCNVTLKLLCPIHKCCVVNTTPDTVFQTPHLLPTLRMGPLS